MAAILGAEEFEFGKLLLIAEGCIMARICEKNTCPRGIATHDPKFKAKYIGQKDHVVRLMQILAEDVRRHLARLGVLDLASLVGSTDLLQENARFVPVIADRNLDLSLFMESKTWSPDHSEKVLEAEPVSELNEKLLAFVEDNVGSQSDISTKQSEILIKATDRAAGATLSGVLANQVRKERLAWIESGKDPLTFHSTDLGKHKFTFRGSAGQGFGVFLTEGLTFELIGEANDSVGKSMSGGEISIRPVEGVRFAPHENAIIGNVALYGATAGSLYVNGMAGDRFAVRNSGANAVVEGVGLHACEYMTGGTVVILGRTSENIGAGMTGGRLFVYLGKEIQEEFSIRPFESAKQRLQGQINAKFLTQAETTGDDKAELRALLELHIERTGSPRATRILENWKTESGYFQKYVPQGDQEMGSKEENAVTLDVEPTSRG
jgi:glutamate synthase domain-containing protein 3